MTRLRSFLTSGLITGLPEAGIILLGMVQVYLINSLWGLATLGQVAVLSAVCFVVRALGFPGTREAVMRFFRQARDAGDDPAARFYFALGLGSDLMLAVLISAGLFGLWTGTGAGAALVGWFGGPGPTVPPDATLGRELAVFFAAQLMLQIQSAFLAVGYAEKWPAWTALTGLTEMLVRVLVLAGMAAFVTAPALIHVALAYLLGAVVALLFIASAALPLVRAVRPRGGRAEVTAYLRFSLTTYVSNAMKASRGRFDTLILAAFAPPALVGVYETLKKFAGPLNALTRPLQILFSKPLITAYDAGQVARIDRLIVTSGALVLGAGGLVVAAFFAFAGPIFGLFQLPVTTPALWAMALLFAIKLFNPLFWWGRSFGLMYAPRTVILWNALATAGAVLGPVLLLRFTGLDQVVALCLGTLLGLSPAWLLPMRTYLAFRREKQTP